MKYYRLVLGLLRRGLLCLFLFYWTIFVSGSIVKLISGGPHRVAAWYEHIFWTPMVGDCIRGTCTFSPSDLSQLGWGRFWTIQLAYLTITLIPCIIEQRSWKKRY